MLTLLHPLVDFCSVAVLVTGGNTVERWFAYNALAFALQLPLGVALDARPGWLRAGFAVGCALAAGGAMAAAFGWTGWLPLVATCVGNALFHLSAGVSTLERSPGRSGPIGLFISTGALGLMAGQMVVTYGWVRAVVPVAVTLVAGATWQVIRWQRHADMAFSSQQVSRSHAGCMPLPWVTVVLFALIVWRSWAGLLAGGMASGTGIAFVLAGAAVTWAGKAAGGYAADLLCQFKPFEPDSRAFTSRAFVALASAAGSAALCFACSPSHVAAWLALLFVAQLATGPVLSLMHEATGRRAGAAFGLNCFGLFTGSLI